jgi:pyruvate dehydrogenase E1 component alpha subunit
MQHVIILPDLGQTTSEAKVVQWLKRPGDRVNRGEALVTVETDKVNLDVESFASGYVRELLVEEGAIAVALSPIAILTDGADEPLAERPAAPAAAEDDQRIGLLRQMLLCRMFEERVYYLFLEGRLPGTIHQSQGQEACAVGVCSVLRPGDVVTSTHRPHHHAVARGIPVRSLIAELFAKQTGCCAGKGGSMHIGDLERGMLPAIAIVAGGIPLAAGYALAMKYRETGNIVACFFGDGATNNGAFHEGVNIAAIWDLPVVFVCENNLYGASTAIGKVTRVPRLSNRAAAYGIPARTVDGNDVEAVHSAMSDAAERARAGEGPTFLELETYRFAGHSRSDPGHYRSKDELAEWKRRDPIARYEALFPPQEVERIRKSVEQELDDAIAFAESSPDPVPEDCLAHVYAE